MDGTHLIGHRTDTANTRNDIDDFMVAAAFQKFFEKPRRFVNIEFQLGDLILLY